MCKLYITAAFWWLWRWLWAQWNSACNISSWDTLRLCTIGKVHSVLLQKHGVYWWVRSQFYAMTTTCNHMQTFSFIKQYPWKWKWKHIWFWHNRITHWSWWNIILGKCQSSRRFLWWMWSSCKWFMVLWPEPSSSSCCYIEANSCWVFTRTRRSGRNDQLSSWVSKGNHWSPINNVAKKSWEWN